jgi:PEP-CTERM motif
MDRKTVIVTLTFLLLLAGVGTASANLLGINITTPDGNAVSGYNGGIGKAGEDNETEGNPSTIQAQAWDLEGMFLKGNSLGMVGGFEFDTGVKHNGHDYTSGDIFIRVANSGLPWDYAIRMNFDPSNPANNTYDILELTASTTYLPPTDVASSGPFKVGTGYSVLQSGLAFSFGTIADSGFDGWTDNAAGSPNWVGDGAGSHYQVSGFDLGFLGAGTSFTTHFTMECGNDLLTGQSTTVPEPATLVLLGIGMAGVGMVAKRKTAQ